MYLTANHAINGSSSSFKDRQALVAFSDYYNEDFKPVDDFGINFFDEWGHNHSGLIPPPTERLDLRRLRQFIGEDFLSWAGEYFNVADPERINSYEVQNMNHPIPRAELYNDFLEKTPTQRRFMTPHRFKRKMIAWCEYHKAKFNPHVFDKIGKLSQDDKRGGVEYFTIGNEKFG